MMNKLTGLRRALVQIALLAGLATTAHADVVFLDGDSSDPATIGAGDAAVFTGLASPGPGAADPFSFQYYFDLAETAAVNAFVGSFNVPPIISVENLALGLYDLGNNLIAGGSGAGFVFDALTAGTYYLRVSGNATGAFGGFTFGALGASEPSPVPLPAAAWLLLSGLGCLAMIARRRVAAAA